MNSDRVGLIGVGLLGSAMAEQWLQAGLAVLAFDTDRQRRDWAGSQRIQTTEDIGAVAHQCRRIVLSLPDSSVSQNVIDELSGHFVDGTILIDTTTGDPSEMRAMGEQLKDRGVHSIDATVAGSSEQMKSGDVLILLGGEANEIEHARPILDPLSSQQVHCGSRGAGAQMKLVVNLVLGLNRAVLAEGLSFAKSLGIDSALALEVLQISPAASGIMKTKGPKMIEQDFSPQARLRQHLKDVRLILGQNDNAKLPLSSLHADLLQSLVDRGYSDEDNSAVIRAFE